MLLREIMNDVFTNLTMASGTGTQIYAEDRVAYGINAAFITIFEMRYWDRYTTVETMTLDGTTGRVTEDVSTKIRKFIDIENVWLPGQRAPLVRLTHRQNPLIATRTGFRSNTDPTKVFTVLPLDTTGDIGISYRTRPATRFTVDQDVPMDEYLLIEFACHQILTQNGSNDEAAKMHLGNFSSRLKILQDLETQHDIALDDYGDQASNDGWTVLP